MKLKHRLLIPVLLAPAFALAAERSPGITTWASPHAKLKSVGLTALHVAEDVCAPVAHRQVVLTIPKRLRLHTRFDRKLLGQICSCAWTCIQAEVRRLLGRATWCPAWSPRSRRSVNSCTDNLAHNAPLVSHANSP